MGGANIISGLESALEGCVAGDEFNVTVQPEQGYGNVNPDLCQSIPRSAFDTVKDLQVGMQLQSTDSKGEVIE
jgi:FKBP-type peptidyl-prolyl cis-trans isomerase SlyD